MTLLHTKLSKEDLIKQLRYIADLVNEDDSFDGSIEYEIDDEPNMFRVRAFYRTGNSMGQGGSTIIGHVIDGSNQEG